jgi:hypothetical protein
VATQSDSSLHAIEFTTPTPAGTLADIQVEPPSVL